MNEFGIEIITANCEYAGSQWEINFRPGAGLAGPDSAFSFKNATKEIARMLDCPIGTIRSRLHRARALLPAKLEMWRSVPRRATAR